ncbi:hypothetical protein PHET_07427 [Paragonimus heterotremus]|uniref:Methyltransferase domain-containing protein n=1 Tax=Paragonimus heterotremus TaxID=100268 RepID=A0A8J4SWQ3_9TREM|nr:hypothetical protein PHET_07427 [Paragonimus heterotremus]
MFSRDLETNVLKPLLELICSIFIYAAIFILFGAPFLEQHVETFSLAVVLTCLTTLPFIVFDDISIKRINVVYFSPRQPHEWFLAFLGYGSLLGTWSSACLLILDWDRPWQAWPYPCVMGAFVGASIGLLLFLIRPYFIHFWHQTHAICCKRSMHSLPSDVKALVRGSLTPHHWPPDILQFAHACRKYTRLLTHHTALNSHSLCKSDAGHLVPNQLAQCCDYVNRSRIAQLNCVNMSPKKQHEVERMVCLTEHVLHDLTTCVLINRRSKIADNLEDDEQMSTFQTCSLLKESNMHIGSKCKLDSDGFKHPCAASPWIVDIGSGLGHLPNAIAVHLCQSTREGSYSERVVEKPSVVAVECDPILHHRAQLRLLDKRFKFASPVRRILFRLESTNVNEFKRRLHELFQASTTPFPTMIESDSYLITGLHCCGDLSQAIIRLFHADESALGLILVGCCYHKMTLSDFPTSSVFREAATASKLPQFFGNVFSTEATFRLACQWSPSTWLLWTAHDFNVHRIRFLHRVLFSVCLTSPIVDLHGGPENLPVRKAASDPIAAPEVVALLDGCLNTDSPVTFSHVFPVLMELVTKQLHFRSIPNLSPDLFYSLERLWDLTPSLLALQQLLQPLLEMVILADRLWFIREGSGVSTSGLVRLFDPLLSPRCVALVARKT